MDNQAELLQRLSALEAENERLKHSLRLLGRGVNPLVRRRRSSASNGQGRIFGYARASSEKQEDSVPMQDNLIRKKVGELHGKLIRIWTDDAVSATAIRWCERVGFMGLMREIQPADHLIVTRLDRIERNPFAMLDALRWLVDRGVSVHVLEYGGMELDLDKPMGRLLVMMLAGFAGFFVDQLKETNRNAWHWRHERGLSAGGTVEFGKRRVYRIVPDPSNPGHHKRQGYDDWDESDCDIMREIWRRHEIECESLGSIAMDLIKRNVRRHDGRPWAYLDPKPDRKGSRNGMKRTISRAFWKYTAMLAAGRDLQDLVPPEEHVELARQRIAGKRREWADGTTYAGSGKVPKEICEMLADGDLEGVLTAHTQKWGVLYGGPCQP